MDMSPAEMRKMQEQTENILVGGYHKIIAKFHRSLYDEYIKIGFTPEQSLDLVKALIYGCKG